MMDNVYLGIMTALSKHERPTVCLYRHPAGSLLSVIYPSPQPSAEDNELAMSRRNIRALPPRSQAQSSTIPAQPVSQARRAPISSVPIRSTRTRKRRDTRRHPGYARRTADAINSLPRSTFPVHLLGKAHDASCVILHQALRGEVFFCLDFSVCF